MFKTRVTSRARYEKYIEKNSANLQDHTVSQPTNKCHQSMVSN